MRRDLRHFGQELAHFAVHTMPGTVRWFDGDHGFNPYHFAELNMERGHQADHGADRVLIKRCLTAFQWESQMDTEIAQQLATDDVAVALAVPYDNLFTHMELQDWEQEDYLRYNLQHLKRLAAKHATPIVAMVDMQRLWRTHPTLASMVYDQVDQRWSVDRPDQRWRLQNDVTGEAIDPYLRRQVTLLDYVEEAPVVLLKPRTPSLRPPA